MKALAILFRYGFTPVKQAVASGQYDFPKGLFFGGKKIQDELKNYQNWIINQLSAVKHILAIDVHTGLGIFGNDILLVEENIPLTTFRELESFFGKDKIQRQSPNTNVGYSIKGSISQAIPKLLSTSRVDFLTQEFGTFSLISSLFALREENRLYYYGQNSKYYPSIKNKLRETFYPSSTIWRKKILSRGVQLVYQAEKFIS